MKFIADLHVHSKYSLATARNLDLEHLHIAAQLKGISVVATGDFTHPDWFSEIKEKLVPAEDGLFRLHPDLAKTCDEQVPPACRHTPRFMLVAEISNIYKKKGKTRKNHNLIFVPDLESAQTVITKLDVIGNIRSDGRPILGLDARDLLELLLDSSENSFLIPAHIWTPWFSLLGSKSGFDAIEACFEDLTPFIFAVETGLSSDPAMNWRVSNLDGLTLVSNSDAHSPLKLGREANLLDTDLSYTGIRSAIQSGDPARFLGTLEYFPEEGKYHLDGHRKCRLCFDPRQSIAHEGICPICHKPLTLGVLHRVEALADRPPGRKPEKTHPFRHLVPLTDILSEILKVGPGSKRVQRAYHDLLKKLGPEFAILEDLSTGAIAQGDVPLLSEAVRRVRSGEVERLAGYDGQFGRIKIFRDSEWEQLQSQRRLFDLSVGDDPAARRSLENDQEYGETPADAFQRPTAAPVPDQGPRDGSADAWTDTLNTEQRQAVEWVDGPLLIVAGPGTGKTRTLTCRIAHLILQRSVSSEKMAALTFTHKAADEMRARLKALLSDGRMVPLVGTFHALCLRLLKNPAFRAVQPDTPAESLIIDEAEQHQLMAEAVEAATASGVNSSFNHKTLLQMVASAKQHILGPGDHLAALFGDQAGTFSVTYRCYQELLSTYGLCDFEDLIFSVVRTLESHPALLQTCQKRLQFIFVDEYTETLGVCRGHGAARQ